MSISRSHPSHRLTMFTLLLMAILAGCGSQGGSNDSGFVLPWKTITIDGDMEDWSDLMPVYTDAAGDEDPLADFDGTDLAAFYLAQDQEFIYFLMTLYDGAPRKNHTFYNFVATSEPGHGNTYGDPTSGVGYVDGCWRLTAELWDEHGYPLDHYHFFSTKNVAVGPDLIEWKVPKDHRWDIDEKFLQVYIHPDQPGTPTDPVSDWNRTHIKLICDNCNVGDCNAPELRSQFVIPSKTITIDGEMQDWTVLMPAYADGADDQHPLADLEGTDLDRFYLAQDQEFIYFLMTLHDGPPRLDGTLYFFVANQVAGVPDTYGDLESVVSYGDGHWNVWAGFRDQYGHQLDHYHFFSTQNVATGPNLIEWKVPKDQQWDLHEKFVRVFIHPHQEGTTSYPVSDHNLTDLKLICDNCNVGDSSDPELRSEFVIPAASIAIDGEMGDWSDLVPAYTDGAGDENPFADLEGTDLDSFYIAQDQEFIYFLMTLHDGAPRQDGTTYFFVARQVVGRATYGDPYCGAWFDNGQWAIEAGFRDDTDYPADGPYYFTSEHVTGGSHFVEWRVPKDRRWDIGDKFLCVYTHQNRSDGWQTPVSDWNGTDIRLILNDADSSMTSRLR